MSAFNKTVISRYALIMLFFLVSAPSFLFGQSQNISNGSSRSNWEFTVSPYLLFPGMNGEVGIRDISVDVDASTGDIFGNLDGGFMLYFEAKNEYWVLSVDGLFMNLGAKGSTLITDRDARVDMKQGALDFKGMFRITEWFDLGLGARINMLDGSTSVAEGVILPSRKVSAKETWFDPMIAARATYDFNGSPWRLQLNTDIGGFAIGSDLTWQVKPLVGYRFSDLFELSLDYRWIGIDYSTGKGDDYFKYDMVISGPEIGLWFHF